ncbi:MAG: LCP family protein [Peptostreptococcaceae bacterium]|nr:LCP family protein [Peptostreptococcaceae bacterium]MDY5739202.1 LCP family protein [Anaerovoracaceae bacterium]
MRKSKEIKTGKKKMKTWVKVLIGVLIVAVAVAGGLYLYANSKLNKVKKVKVDEKELSIVDVNGYANILLLGVDSRDIKDLKGSRTDAIMIISINEKTKDVKLVSVYRDTIMKMGDTESYDKIAHAFHYGGAAMTIKSLNQAMDLNIKKFAIVNFKSVADIVDAVGGIEVDVEDYEIPELNKYIHESSAIVGKKAVEVTQPGTQTLNGVQALTYARIRKGVGDDFKRTERMRIVVTKVFEKMKKAKVNKLDKIMDLMLPQVKTNLSNSDIFALASRLGKYKVKGTTGWPYEVQGGMLNGASYVFPVDMAANSARLHLEIFNQKDYKVTEKLQAISNQIAMKLNGAGAPDPAEVPIAPPAPVTPPVQETPQEPTPPEPSNDNNQGGNNQGNEGNQGGEEPQQPQNPNQPQPGN